MKKNWQVPEILVLDVQETFQGAEESQKVDGFVWDNDNMVVTFDPES